MTLTVQPTSNRAISQHSKTLAVLLILAFACTVATAQESAPGSGPVATLRVSTNIIQIPVFVLTKDREDLHSPLAPNRFEVRLGDGPWTPPKYVRLEGEDPISLAILLDPRPPQSDLLAKMDQALSSLASSSLTSKDRVSIFMMGCSSMQVIEDLPADPGQLRSAVDSILQTRAAKDSNGKKIDCKENPRLWDALAFATHKMEDKPGRRTILAITNGDDKGSKIAPLDLISLAQQSGVTIFALDPVYHINASPNLRSSNEHILSAIAESSGGMRLEQQGMSIDKDLRSFVKRLRARYIVQFPRPSDVKAGRVEMAVRISGAAPDAYFIRIAGKSVPLPNPGAEGNGAVQMAAADEPSNDTIQPPPPQTAAPATTTQPPANEEHPANTATQSAPSAPQPADAQSPVASRPESPAAITTLRLSTKLTVEDVAVNDNNRKPVHGLTKDDFELKEDGHLQIIKHFEEYAGKASDQTPPPTLAANIYSNTQPADTGAVNILLLDNVTTGLSKGLALAPENIAYARQQSMNYLRNLPPGTRVAVLLLGANVRVLQSVTTDKSLLTASINSMTYQPVPGTYVSARGPGAACFAANTQSQLIVDQLQQLAAYLAGIEGRKNLIWFTPGIPWLTQHQDYSQISCLRDFSAQLHKAYSALTASRVALYPIDPRGLFTDPALSAASDSRSMQSVPGMPMPPSLVAPPIREAAAFAGNVQGDHDSLKILADATGGIPYFNRNDLDAALGEAIATGSAYYTLAYTPPLSGYDGKFHTISVKVDKPNLRLQFRTGYTSLDPSKVPPSPVGKTSKSDPKPQELFQTAMVHGAPNSTQLTFDVHVTALGAKRPDDPMIGTLNPALAGKQLVRYEFLYVVSSDQISLVDDANGLKTGEIEFVLAAYDSDGKLLNGTSQTAHFVVKPPDVSRFIQKPMQVPIQFDLPPGNVFVRVGIRDVPSQKSGTLEVAQTIAKK